MTFLSFLRDPLLPRVRDVQSEGGILRSSSYSRLPRDAPLVGSSSYFRLVRQSKTLNNLLDDYSKNGLTSPESAYTNIESLDLETEHTFEGSDVFLHSLPYIIVAKKKQKR